MNRENLYIYANVEFNITRVDSDKKSDPIHKGLIKKKVTDIHQKRFFSNNFYKMEYHKVKAF